MATPTPALKAPFTIPTQTAAVVYFAALMLIFVSKWQPPVSSPTVVYTVFGILGTVALIVQYELQFIEKPDLSKVQPALFAGLGGGLAIVAGQISMSFATYWYAGLIVAVIGAFVAAYIQLGGSIPATPPATST